MHDRLAGGKVTACQGERAHLPALIALDPHHRTDAKFVGGGAAQVENDCVAAGHIVAADRHRTVEAGIDQVKVAVAVEIAKGRTEAHAHLIEPPSPAHFLETQVAEVVVGEVPLREHRRGLHDAATLAHALAAHHALDDVLRVEFAHHAVGEECVEPPVEIEVLQPHGPGPVGHREPGQLRRLERPTGAGAEQQSVAHDLGRGPGARLLLVQAGADLGHAALVLLPGGGRHVGDEQIHVPVVVHVTEVGPHRGVRRVRHGLVKDVGERAVAVVVVELVGILEIVVDV